VGAASLLDSGAGGNTTGNSACIVPGAVRETTILGRYRARNAPVTSGDLHVGEKRIPTIRITQGTFGSECAPFVELPAWWSGFLFHVLSARQVSLYIYLSMLLGSDLAEWYPTTKEICEDLGLASVAVVFAAMKELVDDGFILRERRARDGRRGRHNVYTRPSCEFTIYRLLTNRRIDAMLRARPGVEHRMSPEARGLRDEWLRGVLKDRFERYGAAALPEKRELLLAALEDCLSPAEGA